MKGVSKMRLLETLQEAMDTVRGWGGSEGLRWPPVRDWQRDPYYAWAWPHARGRVVEALQVAVNHPHEVFANPETLKAVKILYRMALEAGLPVPDGVRALIRGRGGAQ